jgi:phospholipase C
MTKVWDVMPGRGQLDRLGQIVMWKHLEQAELEFRLRHRSGQPDRPLPDPSRPAGTDLLPQIRHIVVLMMENHSYDNYLGMLTGRGDGFPLGDDGKPEVFNRDTAGEPIRAHHLSSTVQRPQVPSQSWHATHHQWDEGTHQGFVTSTQVVVPAAGDVDAAACEGAGAAVGMGYWSAEDLPFYYGLARTFPLADRWFSSCLGPTFPNRRFLIAGTAHGLIDDAPSDLLDYPPGGTIFDLLSRHGISWVNYHPVGAGQSGIRRYARHQRRMARRRLLSALRAFPGAAKGVEKDLQFTADIFPMGVGRYVRHVRPTDQFFADADNGTLPAFSIVDPDFTAYSEENPQDIRKGESFAAEVIKAVMHGKGWPHTLLIWLYDEHGRPAGRRCRAQRDGQPGQAAGLPADDLPEEGRGRRQPGCRPAPLRPVRVPGTGGPGIAVRAPRLRLQRGIRSHLRAQAGGGEMEPAPADRQGRGGDLAAQRAGPDRAARLPRSAGPA